MHHKKLLALIVIAGVVMTNIVMTNIVMTNIISDAAGKIAGGIFSGL